MSTLSSFLSQAGLVLLAAVGLAVLAIPQEMGVPSTATYKVQSGDTLGEIAKRHGTSPEQLQAINAIRNPKALKPGQLLRVPLGYQVYEVKAGDTVAGIAKKFGLTDKSVIAFNALKDPHDIAIGQDLRIPGPGSTANAPPPAAPAPRTPGATPSLSPAAPQLPLPPGLLSDLNRIKVAASKWKYIVVHHSASAKGSAASMEAYHRNERHMENGLAYHFVIGNGAGMREGEIAIGSRWKRQIKGGHLASPALNEVSVGICLVGNFETARPSAVQLRSLRALLAWLTRQTRVPKINIRTHTQINTRPTACPGKLFPTRDVANWTY